MKIGLIGLGRMGRAMVLHALEEGIDVVAYNRTAGKVDELKFEYQNSKSETNSKFKNLGQRPIVLWTKNSKVQVKSQKWGELLPAYSVEELLKNLEAPRVVILMVPEGEAVSEMIGRLIGKGNTEVSRGNHIGGVMERGDTIIDGGNCFYRDSQRHYKELRKMGINYLDMGTSGGIEGARRGACLMIGGDAPIYNKVKPLFEALACDGGYAYFGPSGAGHFVKMVHNGVEYGMLEALGEGFEILEKGMPSAGSINSARPRLEEIDLGKVAKNWSHGSVIRGWLMELLERSFDSDPRLDNIEGVVGGGTTGGWTEQVAMEEGVSTPVISASLRVREASQTKPTFSGKVVAALRNQFGGHEVKIKNQKSNIKNL